MPFPQVGMLQKWGRVMNKVRFLVLLVLAAGLLCVLPGVASAERCHAVAIGSKLTADHSWMVYHTEELAPNDAQHLSITPRERHALGETVKAGYEVIPQVPVTWRYVSNRYWPDAYPPGDWSAGMNEWGVCIVADSQRSKETPLAAGKGLSWCALGQVAIERSKTALQAVKTLGWLIDTYGTAGTIMPESSWIVADKHGAWVVESSIRHWVARRIRTDEIFALSNRYTIGSNYDLGSSDLISYATAQGWYDPTKGVPFSWMDAYGKSQGKQWLLNREARIHELLDPKRGHIAVKDAMAALRDHYDGTAHATASPHEIGLGASDYVPLCSGPSCFGVIYKLRTNLPTDIGCMMWYRMTAACTSVNVPIYPCIKRLPPVYTMENTNVKDVVSAWWRFRTLMDNVDVNYAALSPHVRAAWAAFEASELRSVPALERRALSLQRHGHPARAHDLLTAFSNSNLIKAYRTAKTLNDWVVAQP
jgi:dipeptidase